MNEVTGKLIVMFDNPFWIGIFEKIEKEKLFVCKVTFGSEPKDYEVFEFILKNYNHLNFSTSVDVVVKKEHTNPKRMQREVKKQILKVGIGTKSQQALQLQREEMKMDHKIISKEKLEAEKQRKFELKKQKRKLKHKGR